MKSKKLLILISIVLIIGLISIILYNNRIVSKITLDINPSIEIDLNKNDKVIKVIPINKDAKDITNDDFKGKTLNNTLKKITNNVIEKGIIKENYVSIIIHSEGSIKSTKIENNIQKYFNEKEIAVETITIDNITKEDEKLAKKYNISPAKASYIKSITDNNKDIKIEDLSNKPVNEIKETKETGKYCSKDYTLKGDWCYKEIDRKKPTQGEICPEGYYEYKDKCYEEQPSIETDKLLCREEFSLDDKTCKRTTIVKAEVSKYTCSSGEVKTEAEVGNAPYGSGDANKPVCVSSSTSHAVTPCNLPASDPTERMSSGGKCYWHKAPVIPEGCPGKIKVNGFCWDDATNVYLCPNSKNSNPRTANDICYTILKNVKPVPEGYKCEDGMTLKEDKCVREEQEPAIYERTCPNGYNLVNNDRCINYKKIKPKENGLICEGENAELKNNTCIIYEVIEAK